MEIVIRVTYNPTRLGLTRFQGKERAVIDLFSGLLEDTVYIDSVLNHELMHVRSCELFNKSNCLDYADFEGLNQVLPIAKKLLQNLLEKDDFVLYNLYSGLDLYMKDCEIYSRCNSEEIILHVYSILYILIFKYNHKELEQDYLKVLDVLRTNNIFVPYRGLFFCPCFKFDIWNPQLKEYIEKFYKTFVQ